MVPDKEYPKKKYNTLKIHKRMLVIRQCFSVGQHAEQRRTEH